MKRLTTFIGFFCAVLSASAQSANHTASIQSATIYLQGASLVHNASINLQKGAQEITIDGLSPIINLGSLKVKADGGVLISSSSFATGKMNEESAQMRLGAMRDSLATLQSKAKDCSDKVQIGKTMLTLLSDGITSRLKGGSSDVSASLEQYRKNAENIYAQLKNDEECLAGLNGEISSLKARIAKCEAAATKECGILTLSITAPAKTKSNIEISYFTDSASWMPTYEINIPSMGRPAELKAKASVRQRTGLDWNGVALTLTNSRPSQSNQAPSLYAWRLRFPETVLYKPMMAKAATFNSAVAMDSAEEMEEAASMDDYVEIQETDMNVEYAISLPYNIPGSNSAVSIDLKNYEMPAEYYYLAVPKLSSEVYMMGKVADWHKFNLLPGRAFVSFDGTLVGQTYLDTNTTDDSLELTLGIAKGMSVSRSALSEEKSKTIIGGNTVQTRSWEIKVRNNMSKDARIMVKDQIPLSADKEIEVKANTGDATLDSASGILTWDTTISPSQTRSFKFGFTVKYPKDKNVPLG